MTRDRAFTDRPIRGDLLGDLVGGGSIGGGALGCPSSTCQSIHGEKKPTDQSNAPGSCKNEAQVEQREPTSTHTLPNKHV